MARIQVSTTDSLEHIFRKIDTPNKILNDENLFFLPHCDNHADYNSALRFKENHIKQAEQNYKNLTGQKVQSKTNRSYSAVFECNENTTAADIYEMLGKKIETELDTKIFAIAIHRDEGCLIDKNGIRLTSGDDFLLDKKGQYWLRAEGDKKGFFRIKLSPEIFKERGLKLEQNYHAHIEFCGLRSNGRSIQDTKDPRIKSGEIQRYTPQHYAKDLCEYAAKIFNIADEKKILGLFERLKSVDNPQINELFSEMEQPKIKRIKGAKHLLSNLNSLANGEKLHKRDLAATKSMLKQCGVDNFLLLEAERKRAKEREAELEIQIKAADDVITHTIADKDTQINDLNNQNQQLTDRLNKLTTAIEELKKELKKETAECKQWKSWAQNAQNELETAQNNKKNADNILDDIENFLDLPRSIDYIKCGNQIKAELKKLTDLSDKRSKTAQRLAKTRKVAQNAQNELEITKKQIAERIEAERKKWIAEQGHTKEDYAALSAFKRECLAVFEEQGVKSMAELNDKIAALNAEINAKDAEILTKNLDLIELGVLRNENQQLTQKNTEISTALKAAQNTQSNNDDSENATYKNHHK